MTILLSVVYDKSLCLLNQLAAAMSGEPKENTSQLSSLKAIAEQAIVQASLFPSSKKLPDDSDTLRSE